MRRAIYQQQGKKVTSYLNTKNVAKLRFKQ